MPFKSAEDLAHAIVEALAAFMEGWVEAVDYDEEDMPPRPSLAALEIAQRMQRREHQLLLGGAPSETAGPIASVEVIADLITEFAGVAQR